MSKQYLNTELKLSNVCFKFHAGCQLDVEELEDKFPNAKYSERNKVLGIHFVNPKLYVKLYPSGWVLLFGVVNPKLARSEARRIQLIIQKVVPKVRFQKFSIFNILASCSLPYNIELPRFFKQNVNKCKEPKLIARYCDYVIKGPHKALVKLYCNGGLTIMAATVEAIEKAMKEVYAALVRSKAFERPVKAKGIEEKVANRQVETNAIDFIEDVDMVEEDSEEEESELDEESDDDEESEESDTDDDDFVEV